MQGPPGLVAMPLVLDAHLAEDHSIMAADVNAMRKDDVDSGNVAKVDYEEVEGKPSLVQASSAAECAQSPDATPLPNDTQEYKDLYYNLLHCFTEADTAMSGVIDAKGFNSLFDTAAVAPCMFGSAPTSDVICTNEIERKESRAALFKTIDTDGSGTIAFDKFLAWAIDKKKESAWRRNN